MKKVVAVTLNPCVDYTITVPNLKNGQKNLVKSTRKDISGKGINICMQLSQAEQPVISVGFDFIDGRVRVKDALEKMGIEYALVEVSGSLRTNFKVLDTEAKVMTELNERGGSVIKESVREVKRQVCRILDSLEEGSILSVNGSAPQGVPNDFYAQLIEEGKKRRMFTILDASDDLLREGIKARPDLIKPNLYELAQLMGRKAESLDEIIKDAETLHENGIPMVCVSMGPKGAVLATDAGCWYAEAADVPVEGLQGAGDAMVGIMAMQILRDAAPASVLRMGMAAANAKVQLEGTRMPSPLKLMGMMDAITITKVR